MELSAGVIVMALCSSQGFGAERSIGLLTLADGGKYSASLLAFDLNPYLMASRCLVSLLLTAMRAGWSSLHLRAFSLAVRMFLFLMVA